MWRKLKILNNIMNVMLLVAEIGGKVILPKIFIYQQ